MNDQARKQLLEAVQASAKYRRIHPDLIQRIGAQELKRGTSLKHAIKATKNKLHQVAGAFADRPPQYEHWLGELQAAQSAPSQLREICRNLMQQHASTRERLPFLEDFYLELSRSIAPATSIIDLACGLNPLALPWIQPTPTEYLAIDLYSDLCDFLNAAIPLLAASGRAFAHDLLNPLPPLSGDVSLVLKTLPVLEQIRRGAGAELLQQLTTPRIVVSFPTRSLGGRNVGMSDSYAVYMQSLCTNEEWRYRTLEFPNELVFVIDRTTL
jgi:16S rRNA (guanine(1405)-N(7))-methyltransferase